MEERIERLSRPIWERIEQECFVKFGIEHPYYHRGKYNGKAMLKFYNLADKAMNKVKTFLIENIPVNNRCRDSEVISVTTAFTNLFLVFDTIFSLAWTPVGLLMTEQQEKATKSITLVIKLWKELDMSMTPKVHILEDYLLSQLVMFKGLSDYSEDFVEQAHQTGIREEDRTLAIHNRHRVAELHCKMEHKPSLPIVKEKQSSILEKMSWKRKNGGMDQCHTAKSRQKQEREGKHSSGIKKNENEEEEMKNGKRHNYDELKMERNILN